MIKEIKIQDKDLKYNIKKSRRARYMRLTVYCNGNIVATVPSCFSPEILENFILERSRWIFKKLEYYRNHQELGESIFEKYGAEEYKKFKKEALQLADRKLQGYRAIYGLHYKKISIRNQRSRWGSCSRNGNLCFNFRIVFLPEELIDYIIVHELCHLREFNHSPRFWRLVEKTIPNYKEMRREIRRM